MILVCITITFLLSLLISHIRVPFMRKVINTLGGLAITTYCYGLGIFLLVAFSMIGYFGMLLAPRRYCHIVVITVAGTILTAANVYRQVMDITGYHVVTLCMITFVK